ncbi:myosin IB heavy chain isoform X1 [Capsicum annuum]|uniref:myosin IB heavy chain isoform X1 n=1 Tax=Capsicum annuum TaxID=4072 RepID=UPI001FB0D2A5|nr:myosin IB heavy chain isoform X1 [Capsicum annuum]
MVLSESNGRVQLPAKAQTRPVVDDGKDAESLKVAEDQNGHPSMGVEVRRNYMGDYLDVPFRPYLMKILQKQAIYANSKLLVGRLVHCSLEGDKKVLFADRVLKFTSTGKMKRHILLITDFALYIVDPDIDALKRRISLAAVEKLCLSERSDNFLAIIAPTEYDLLIASTRKTEIVSIFVDTTRSQSDYELEVLSSNRFEYNATSELVKEIYFDETEDGTRTTIVRK